MSLHAIVDAHAQGYAENMYLDPATRTYVEETGGANFIFITKDGTFVTPKSDSILPSITRRSLMVVAEKYLHMPVEHRPVKFSEVPDLQSVDSVVLQQLFLQSERLLIMAKKSVSRVEWKKWDHTQRNCVRHLPESRWARLKDRKAGFTRLCKSMRELF